MDSLAYWIVQRWLPMERVNFPRYEKQTTQTLSVKPSGFSALLSNKPCWIQTFDSYRGVFIIGYVGTKNDPNACNVSGLLDRAAMHSIAHEERGRFVLLTWLRSNKHEIASLMLTIRPASLFTFNYSRDYFMFFFQFSTAFWMIRSFPTTGPIMSIIF